VAATDEKAVLAETMSSRDVSNQAQDSAAYTGTSRAEVRGVLAMAASLGPMGAASDDDTQPTVEEHSAGTSEDVPAMMPQNSSGSHLLQSTITDLPDPHATMESIVSMSASVAAEAAAESVVRIMSRMGFSQAPRAQASRSPARRGEGAPLLPVKPERC
jgi:hypothetical protein